MNVLKSKLMIYAVGILILTLAAAVLGTVSFFILYEPEIGYFVNSSPIPTVLTVLAFCAVGAAALAAILFRRGEVSVPDADEGAGRYVAILPACAFLAFAVYGFLSLGTCRTTLLYCLQLIRSLLSLPAALYFIFIALKKRGNPRNYASVVVTFAILLMLATSYMDLYTAINGPVKVPVQLASISALLALLYELRLSLGEGYERPRMALATTSISVFFCISASVPIILAYLGKVLDKTDYFLCAVVLLCIGAHNLSRLVMCVRGTATVRETTPSQDTLDS